MKYGDATMGQFEAVINKLGGMDGLHRFLAGESTIMPQVHKFLGQMREIVLKRSTRSSSIQTRKGLWVSSEFDRLVGSGKATKLQETKIRSFDLIEPANDAEIQGELPKDHAFKATEIRGVLEALIGLQPDGEDGFLLTNGYWNLFYVVGADGGVCVVHVGWHAYDRRWVVDAGPLDDARWSEGRRVLSATA